MNWVVKYADEARAFLNSLPEKARRQLGKSIDQMREDPFRGDVKALQGPAWKGYYRKRTGNYRIIFFPHLFPASRRADG